MNIYIFYKIDHIVIIILVDIFAPEALTKTELCDIILHIIYYGAFIRSFYCFGGLPLLQEEKNNLQFASRESRKKKKEMLSARRLTEKCSAYSGVLAIVRKEKCKKK